NSSVDDCCSREVKAKDECEKAKYDESACKKEEIRFNNMFVMEVENGGPCLSCNAPVKEADEKMQVNSSLEIEGETLPASEAANLMKDMSDLVKNMKGSSAELSLGAGVSGILVKEPDEAEGISFAYSSPNDSMKVALETHLSCSVLQIIDNKKYLDTFSRWISVSKQAFEKANELNVTAPFAAVLRFVNMSKDEYNSSVLGDEVVAIEMGAVIRNLTDTLNITFKTPRNEKMTPHCHSWDGDGDKPNWTDYGCLTIEEESSVTCQCTHMTFFAILMTPINETISSYDLNTLTIISQVGCGLSMFFLSIILFMHFLLRRTKASQSTIIFIHLVASLFLLDFTFLVNNHVANMQSSVGCKIMAAGMHYSMLATFSWFSAQALHLCLQMYKGGNILIKRYVLKVSLASWSLPGVTVIVLLILGKYGEQTIKTEDSQYNVKMCWINDNDIHYIVNIGYYMIVFLFTFSTAIITLWWLFNLKRIKKDSKQEGQNGKGIVAILGLCLQLGITWAFAFFAYGAFRIPATYIFTVLNSFQGMCIRHQPDDLEPLILNPHLRLFKSFFLFIYYQKTSHSNLIDSKASSGSSNTCQTSTCSLKTKVDTSKNPYKK
ncbi:unnamed protein product, partial [Menidia menidia]